MNSHDFGLWSLHLNLQLSERLSEMEVEIEDVMIQLRKINTYGRLARVQIIFETGAATDEADEFLKEYRNREGKVLVRCVLCSYGDAWCILCAANCKKVA